MEDWLVELVLRHQELLDTVDRLLLRHSGTRHRSDSSFAGGLISGLLPGLTDLQEVLPKTKPLLLSMEMTLRERMDKLNRCSLPPGPGSNKLRAQCRELLLQMARLPAAWNEPSVLVGSLRMPSQLEVCLSCGFYHVPASQLPEQWLPVDYVAIYQSRAMFQKDCGIRYYGKVKSCTRVRRWEIEEIPKSSEEWYYRLEIPVWEQLESPVAVREVPFTHLLTNLFLLTHSLETPELCLETPAHYCCFQALRRAVDQGDHTILSYPGGKLRIKNGQLQLLSHGKKLAIYSQEAFLATPSAVFRQIIPLLEPNITLRRKPRTPKRRSFLGKKKPHSRRR